MDKGRHTHHLTSYSRSQQLKRKEKVLFTARKEVDINGNGTSGYVIKHGPRQGTVLGHIKVPTRAI